MAKTITVRLNGKNETSQRFYEALEKRDTNLFPSQSKYIMHCVLTVSGGDGGGITRKDREMLKGIMKEALGEFEAEKAVY